MNLDILGMNRVNIWKAKMGLSFSGSTVKNTGSNTAKRSVAKIQSEQKLDHRYS